MVDRNETVNGVMTLSATTATEDLVRRAQNGETSARDELARENQRAAFLFALHLVGNHDDALDISQEAMLRFFSTLDRFQSGRAVRPWLFAIVRNQARDFWRRSKLRRHESLDESIPDLSRALVDDGDDPEQSAFRREQQARVWRVVSRLPRAQREILVLRDFHDLSYEEIATVLGIPMGTVMSRLHAARMNLRRKYLALASHQAARSDS
ncbi:MAG: sigma-70 family RNA polymerase sigma factor [Acidobacteriota bacterium]|nr:sigma-70 family RNA polymerase sigma factor [Acidobacteriota bacterium]